MIGIKKRTPSLRLAGLLLAAFFAVHFRAGAELLVTDATDPLYYRVAAAGSDLQIEKDTEVTGDLHSNGAVAIKKDVTVDGGVTAAGTVANQGTVSGAVTENADPVAFPPIPAENELRALADRIIEGDVTFTDETLDDVVFVDGTVVIAGTLQGEGTILASADVRLREDATPLGGETRISIIAFGGIRIDKGRPFRGVLRAGGDVDLQMGVVFEGVAIADGKIHVKKDSHLTFLSLDQAPPVIFLVDPEDGAVLDASPAAIVAAWSDDFSGIDPTTAAVLLDGVDRTAEAVLDGETLTLAVTEPLANGLHTVEISVADHAGNQAQASFGFEVITDDEPPLITDLQPAAGAVVTEPTPEIGASYRDDDSGVDPGSVTLLLDGNDRTQEATVTTTGIVFRPAAALAPGEHQVELRVADVVGNVAEAAWTFNLVTGPPEVVIEHPADGSFTNQATVEVRGTVTGGGPIASVLVNDQPAEVDGEAFSITLALEEGINPILVLATDAFDGLGAAGVTLTLDTEPPQLELSAPKPRQLFNGGSVRVTGVAVDSNPIESVTVEGVAVPVVGRLFTTEIEVLQEGPTTITVQASDAAGNSGEVSREVIRFSLPQVRIETPADLSTLTETTVDVAGTVSDDVTSVTVNGVAAALQAASFFAEGVPLIEGGNVVTATATDARGHVATATIHVVRDQTPPRLTIYHPEPGATVYEATVSVSGLVNDIVPGTVNAGEATVTVNGVPAEVVNRSFFAEGVALSPGDNELVAVAVDAGGNAVEQRITVRLEEGPVARVRILSGNHQTAEIGTSLPEPLVVELLSSTGLPVAGATAVFRLVGSDGTLDGGGRQVAVTSDASGRAQSHFTLGNRAGVANQVVEVGAAGFAGPAVFTESALPGAPASIVVDSGGLQVGVAGQRLPRPLIAAVIDAGHNRLEGVPVRFRVIKGQGIFADGSQESVQTTDSDGRAVVAFSLDPEEGIADNVVLARVQGLEDGAAATFVASGRAAGDPAATTISGVVLDNTSVPLEGVTVRVKGTSLTASSDAEGQFRIEGAPVGSVKLIADGSTASRPGSWPDLEFDLVTIAGRINTVNMPIFLLPLDLANGLFVDEIRGGTLTLPQVPGFALEIAPGSVSFPGGGKSGLVSVTVVHNDRVPMVPNFGQQPRLIVTIQPAGARFEPPARLTLPNVEGLSPGEVSEMYSFDHDLGHFVSIGPATVSDDGSVMRSDPGVGIVKAGWHCGGNPSGSGTTHGCPECQTCVDDACVPDPGQDFLECRDDGDRCTREFCNDGECLHLLKEIVDFEATGNGKRFIKLFIRGCVQYRTRAETRHCEIDSYSWDFSEGVTSQDPSPQVCYEDIGVFPWRVEVSCESCDEAKDFGVVKVECPDITITGREPDVDVICPGCDMQFFAETSPSGFGYVWRVPISGSLGGKATIDQDGVLHIADDAPSGEVTVEVAVANKFDESECVDSTTVEVFRPPGSPTVPHFGFNASEIGWLIANHSCGWELKNIRHLAEKATGNAFSCDFSDGLVGNAFHHAFVNCVFTVNCGPEAAEGFWDSHENSTPRDECFHARMDFHNNKVGRAVGRALGPGATADECSAGVIDALLNDGLRWMEKPFDKCYRLFEHLPLPPKCLK